MHTTLYPPRVLVITLVALSLMLSGCADEHGGDRTGQASDGAYGRAGRRNSPANGYGA